MIARYVNWFTYDVPVQDPNAWRVVDGLLEEEEEEEMVIHRVSALQYKLLKSMTRYKWHVFCLPQPVLLQCGFTMVITDMR